jgi:hypothetical protein
MNMTIARDVNLQAIPSEVTMIETSAMPQVISQRHGEQVNSIASDALASSQSIP